jgi:hypothetical protein
MIIVTKAFKATCICITKAGVKHACSQSCTCRSFCPLAAFPVQWCIKGMDVIIDLVNEQRIGGIAQQISKVFHIFTSQQDLQPLARSCLLVILKLLGLFLCFFGKGLLHLCCLCRYPVYSTGCSCRHGICNWYGSPHRSTYRSLCSDRDRSVALQMACRLCCLLRPCLTISVCATCTSARVVMCPNPMCNSSSLELRLPYVEVLFRL